MKLSENLPMQFPKRFFWGVSTAAHQVEGGTHNQWSVWELENAKSLAARAPYMYKHTPKWEDIKKEAADPHNYVSGRAADHYTRYREDFTIISRLHMNAFRFSIEWSRIEPEPGVWNAEALEHYRIYLQTLKKRGIEPFVTLWHWTMPVWFAQMGGFEKRRNVAYFVRFAEKVLQELGREFRYIITINEPEVYTSQSYLMGNWPPNRTSKIASLKVYINLAYAHKRVYKLAKKTSRRFIVGLAKHSLHTYAGDDAKLSRLAARVTTWGADYFFLNQVRRKLDFIGLNYYQSLEFHGYKVHNPNRRINDYGWDMQPQHIQFVIERLHRRYRLPIIITENGCADRDDEFRKWWLMQTIMAMHKALRNGADVQGYLHWSLIDNFEWAAGFWPRFGLVAVDYSTMERTIRPSALWFGKIVKQLRNI